MLLSEDPAQFQRQTQAQSEGVKDDTQSKQYQEKYMGSHTSADKADFEAKKKKSSETKQFSINLRKLKSHQTS